MPHPIVIAAGMAIIVGAGYVIYTELNRKSDEEEAYHTYCATIRAEKESRIRRLQGLRDAELHSAQHSSSASTSKNIHHTSLRHRSTNQSAQGQLDYPLIDLGQQFYPPIPRSHRSSSPTPSASSSKSDLKRLCAFSPILDIPIPDPVIFIAPSLGESVEADERCSPAPQHELSPARDGELQSTTDIADVQPLIDWEPSQADNAFGSLLALQLGSHSQPSDPASLHRVQQAEYFEASPRSETERDEDAQEEEEEEEQEQDGRLSVPDAHHPLSTELSVPASPKSLSELSPTSIPADTPPESDSDDWAVADEPVIPSSAHSPSLDGNWSDLGSDSFEPI